MANVTNIPAPRVPFIDERTGLMSREWYRFFLNLFNLTGSGTNTITLDDLQVAPDYSAAMARYDEAIKSIDALECAPVACEVTADDLFLPSQQSFNQDDLFLPVYQPAVSRRSVAPTVQTAGASPYIYTNDTGADIDIAISGGGVSKLEFSRGGVLVDTGGYYGLFHLSPYDAIQVTYTVAPTITIIPR